MRMTSSEKTSMAESSSRERSSAARSFQTMADTARKNPAEVWRGEALAGRGLAMDCSFATSIHQGRLVEREQVALTEFIPPG